MDAAPLLARIAELLEKYRLEAVLIGNAAAAIQGAPITTIDLDFFFPQTPANLKKLRAIAGELDAALVQPHYPASRMFRIVKEREGLPVLQLDFMPQISGVRSFEGVRRRSTEVQFGGFGLRVASLVDIIKSKEAAGRPQDKAVLLLLEETREEIACKQEGPAGSSQERE